MRSLSASPPYHGVGPGPGDRRELKVSEIDYFEINEAFAVV